MIFFQGEKKARYLSRPNRFQIWVELEGKEELVYLANPGRLLELLHPGKTLWLEAAKNPQAKMPWQAVAIEEDWGLISLNTHKANDMAGYLLNQKQVPGLEDWEVIRREVKEGHSRFDFLLGRGEERLFLEVKSCSLYSEQATQFPDAVTERGRKHLLELTEMAENGQATAALFLSQKQDTDYFAPDWHTDLNFAQAFLATRGKLQLYPLAIHLDPETGALTKPPKALKIPWDLIGREAHDQGSYLYLCHLPEGQSAEIGSLGKLEFEAGYYLYIGSAKVALTKRLARHQKKKKKLHWHLDYLRQITDHQQGLAIRTQDDLECELAAAFGPLADAAIPRFGSSDCTCKSHLFHFAQNPLHRPDFHRLLQHFRIDRHLEKSSP